jgi:hypothetical protein
MGRPARSEAALSPVIALAVLRGWRSAAGCASYALGAGVSFLAPGRQYGGHDCRGQLGLRGREQLDFGG